MALMNPTALLYALLIGALVLIHFRRRSRTTLRVSNLQLWQAASQAREAQPMLERPRADWLLAIQVLFLAAVILALTQPVVWIRGAQPRTVVLVMDCSASMNARERGGTRFDLARAKARALVDQLGGQDRVLLVEARSRPVMRAYAGSERAAVGRALEALRSDPGAVRRQRGRAAGAGVRAEGRARGGLRLLRRNAGCPRLGQTPGRPSTLRADRGDRRQPRRSRAWRFAATRSAPTTRNSSPK